MIKRLVGVEGDIILNSDYSPREQVVVGKGACWVEGDNRENSIDSNSAYGPISQGLIFGKATHVIWPPEEWKRLEPKLPKSRNRTVEKVGVSNVKIVNNAASSDWM